MLTKNDLVKIKRVVDESADLKLKPIKRDIRHIKRMLDTTIDHFYRRVTSLEKRVDRTEDRLQIPHTI